MLRLGSQSIDIPPGSTHYLVSDRYVLPVDVEVVAVQPHAHNLAREVRATAHLPDGSLRPLISIKDWDFRWQDVYRYREPLRLPRGTTLTMEYRYDNSAANIRNPHRPPKRVTFGQTTASEMGNLYVQVVAASREQQAELENDFSPKMLSGDIAGYEKMIEVNPDAAPVRTDLAFLYLAAGRAPEAVAQLQEALRLAPGTASAHYALGTVLLGEGRIADAQARFLRTIELEPRFSAAHNNLGIVSQALGQPDRAIAHYTEALRQDPANRLARYNRGRAYAVTGHVEQAMDDYHSVLQAAPDDADARAGLAAVLAMNGQLDDAITQYRRSIALQPGGVAALVDLSWLLATAEPLGVRSPNEAVELARRADQLTGHRNAAVLETLAVAYFSAGHAGRAVATAEQALAIAAADGATELVETLKKRLAGFQKR
jgi:tetratricopeptide (TPR) repeat protein